MAEKIKLKLKDGSIVEKNIENFGKIVEVLGYTPEILLDQPKPEGDESKTVLDQPKPEDAPSMAGSAARGLRDGLSFGFADEIGAGIESLIDQRPYDDVKKEYDDVIELDKDTNPGSYLIGDTIGAALPVITGVGGAAALAPKLATTAGKALSGSVLGSLSGFAGGIGRDEDAKQVARRTVLGAAGGALGSVASPVAGAVNSAGSRALSKLFGPLAKTVQHGANQALPGLGKAAAVLKLVQKVGSNTAAGLGASTGEKLSDLMAKSEDESKEEAKREAELKEEAKREAARLLLGVDPF